MERLHPFVFFSLGSDFNDFFNFLIFLFFQILVMAKGEVVECGTHKELVAAGTIFTRNYTFFSGFKYFPNIFLYLLIFTSTMF